MKITDWFIIATTFLMFSFGFWFFQETLSKNLLDQQTFEKRILNNIEITVGRKEPCITTVRFTTWESMNELGIYHWVVACENENGL